MCNTPTGQDNIPPQAGSIRTRRAESPPRSRNSPTDPTPDHTPHTAPPLSPTETKVYHLLLKRFTERQVAEHLGRSYNTVHVHVRNIYRKLGIRSRKQLFERAAKNRDKPG